MPKRNISSSGLIFFRLVGPGPFHPPRAIIPICWDCPTSRRFFHSDRLGFRQKPPFSFQYVGIGQKSVFPQFQFVGIVHKSLVKRELQMIRCHSDLLGLALELAVFDSNLLGFASLEKIESNSLEPRYQLMVKFRNGKYL